MSWTSHDNFFGWVHSFRINRNNYFFGGRFGINERPYPAIVNRPAFLEVLHNWNLADTGLVASFFVGGLLYARHKVLQEVLLESVIERRNHYKQFHRIIVAFGIMFALRNSANRLQGYVPNGLPKQPAELVKYDFTSDLINSTFWRYFIESHEKPSAL